MILFVETPEGRANALKFRWQKYTKRKKEMQFYANLLI